jgi:hypothetical protein
MFKARAGHHIAPRKLTSGRDAFEEFGFEFALLAFDADEASVTAFEKAARELGMTLKIVRDSQAGGREDYEARLILVRPDQYVAWCGDAAPTDAGAVLRKVLGL